MWIMIAGPYRSGDDAARAANLRTMNQAALEVWRLGHVPVIGVNMALPLIEAAGDDCYDALMTPVSLALATRCDAILRIGGASGGADNEVEVIRAQGGVVYIDIKEIPKAQAYPRPPIACRDGPLSRKTAREGRKPT